MKVNSIIEIKEALRLAMKDYNIMPSLGDIEWGMLSQLCDVLQTLVQITKGGEAYMT